MAWVWVRFPPNLGTFPSKCIDTIVSQLYHYVSQHVSAVYQVWAMAGQLVCIIANTHKYKLDTFEYKSVIQ